MSPSMLDELRWVTSEHYRIQLMAHNVAMRHFPHKPVLRPTDPKPWRAITEQRINAAVRAAVKAGDA